MTERTKTTVAGIPLGSYAMNASGVLDTTLDELEDIFCSGSSAVVMKSCTLEARKGNPEPRYAHLPRCSLQCMGLPNDGYKKYLEYAETLKTRYKASPKPIIASVAGLSEKDYPVLVEAFQDSPVDLIEVNISCPNLEGKTLIGYDFEQVKRILGSIKKEPKPFGLKLPPYLEERQIQEMAYILHEQGVSFITCINSIPNALVIDPTAEKPILRPKKGLGALCGEYIKPVALGNVKMFYDILLGKMSIIGVGGISTGSDIFDFILAGADAVQIGTFFKENPLREGCFEKIDRELEDILTRTGYADVRQAKGRLKSF